MNYYKEEKMSLDNGCRIANSELKFLLESNSS